MVFDSPEKKWHRVGGAECHCYHTSAPTAQKQPTVTGKEAAGILSTTILPHLQRGTNHSGGGRADHRCYHTSAPTARNHSCRDY